MYFYVYLMNTLDRARLSTVGNFINGTVLKDGKMNIRQTDPVRDANMLNNFKHRPRGTIVSNNQPTTNNIALYAREPNELMLNETLGNEMFLKIRNSNKPKIQTMNEDLIPNTGVKYEIEKFSLDDPKVNKNPYYPRLNISQYNMIPEDIKPTIIDSRMLQFTQERDFNYESDQIENARVLNNDQRRWDRINRQMAADRQLQGLGSGMDNWTENRSGYVNRSAVPPDFIVDETLSKLDTHAKYDNTKDELLINNIANIEKDSLSPANQYYNVKFTQKDYNHLYSGNNDMILNRYMNRNDYGVKFDFDENKQEVKQGILKTISNSILKMFKKDVNSQAVLNHENIKHITTDVENKETNDFNYEGYTPNVQRVEFASEYVPNTMKTANTFTDNDRKIKKNIHYINRNEIYYDKNRNLISGEGKDASFSKFKLK